MPSLSFDVGSRSIFFLPIPVQAAACAQQTALLDGLPVSRLPRRSVRRAYSVSLHELSAFVKARMAV